MPINKKYLSPFEYENIYHVYNRTNNRELLFRTDWNYAFFLKLFAKYISPFAMTYAWCLLPNHFHFLIKIRTEEEILKHIVAIPEVNQTKTQKMFLIKKDIDLLLEMEFKRFFTSYAMSFNKMFARTGNLFCRTFKRVKINSDGHFTGAIIYIHSNAWKHKLVDKIDDYKWTSYHTVVSENPTMLLRDEIIEWFGTKDSFIKSHNISFKDMHPDLEPIEYDA